MNSSTDELIAGLNGYLKANRVSLAEVARSTGLHANTVQNALRRNRGRIDTLQSIELFVEKHKTSNMLAEAERAAHTTNAGSDATRNYAA